MHVEYILQSKSPSVFDQNMLYPTQLIEMKDNFNWCYHEDISHWILCQDSRWFYFHTWKNHHKGIQGLIHGKMPRKDNKLQCRMSPIAPSYMHSRMFCSKSKKSQSNDNCDYIIRWVNSANIRLTKFHANFGITCLNKPVKIVTLWGEIPDTTMCNSHKSITSFNAVAKVRSVSIPHTSIHPDQL